MDFDGDVDGGVGGGVVVDVDDDISIVVGEIKVMLRSAN